MKKFILERNIDRGYFAEPEITIKRCLYIKDNGYQCGNTSIKNSDFCTPHNDLIEKKREEKIEIPLKVWNLIKQKIDLIEKEVKEYRDTL